MNDLTPGSPSQLLEEKVSRLVSDMDDLMILANANPAFIEREAIGIGQIISRGQIILSFLEAKRLGKVRIVVNNVV